MGVAPHLLENFGADHAAVTDAELHELNTAVAAIPIHGDRLLPGILAQTGVEAPPK